MTLGNVTGWQGDFCRIWSCKNYFWFLGGFLLKYAGMLFWYDEMRWEDMGWGKWKGDFCRISKSRIQRKAYQSRFSWNSQAWNVNLAFSFFVLMFFIVQGNLPKCISGPNKVVFPFLPSESKMYYPSHIVYDIWIIFLHQLYEIQFLLKMWSGRKWGCQRGEDSESNISSPNVSNVIFFHQIFPIWYISPNMSHIDVLEQICLMANTTKYF